MRLEFSRTCKVCGLHIGRGYDHSECAKIKQTTHKRRKAKRSKTLSEKSIDYLIKFVNEKEKESRDL